jgi:hypothetical protein
MFEAEDESQQWPELHAAIREARKLYQARGEMPDLQSLAAQTANCGLKPQDLSVSRTSSVLEGTA